MYLIINCKAKCWDFIEVEKIPLGKVGTAFPEIGPRYFKDLGEDQNGFVEKDFDQNAFILYSNVMNDFTDEEMNTLSSMEVLKSMQRGGGENDIV